MKRGWKPSRLRAGDTVCVVAPASNVARPSVLRGVAELERLGFRVRCDEGIYSSERYFAGSHARRIREFQQALHDREVQALFCARGGYGSAYLVGQLVQSSQNLAPKIILGASDLTIIQLHLWKSLGWVTFHGPMVAQEFARGPTAYDAVSLRAALEGAAEWVAAEVGTVIRPGRAEGILLGGCLSLVVTTLGTPEEVETEGTLLLLEDRDTKPYQVDRLLGQLKRAGKFAGVQGIIFGQMPGCFPHPQQGYELTEVIADVLADFAGPIAFGLPFGHATGGTLTLPLGVRARLECDDQPRLTILEAATV